jgi:tetratricopeptide (TPR) repeat protein
MPGNRAIYDQAMNMGHSAAWDQEWDRAIAAYGRAIQEFPEDSAAHNSLGLALLQARRLEDALKVYTRARQLAPDDPIPLEKSADVLERLGRLKEAAQQYVNVAEVYLGQHDMEKAIGNWERATRLTSGLVKIHQRLALAYERTGQRHNAIREYLTLAFNFQRADRTDIALQAVQRALRIEPQNPQALNTLQALKSGSLISVDVLEAGEGAALKQREPSFERVFDEPLVTDREVGEADPRGPLGEAMETALSSLAMYVFESGMQEPGSQQAIQAIEFQRQEMTPEAVGWYERALANKMRHPAVHLNLGGLLLDMERWEDAIKNLELASSEQSLSAGAMHGLSQAYAALDNPRAAAFHLVQALRLVDVGLAMNPDEAGQLSAIYDRLTASIDSADQYQLTSMNRRFLELLTGPDWKQRVAKTRRQLEEAITIEDPESLIDLVPYISDRITEGLNLVDGYLQQGLYTLATDQAHFMLESASDYLPIHWRMGKILLERGQLAQAIEKYNLVARTYLVRKDPNRSAEILQEAISIAPMDTSLHLSLIDLFQQQERWNDLLEQYIELADAYYQLADLDDARDTYQRAVRLAQEIGAPKEKIAQIMHHVADIDTSRLELRQATRIYEEIRKMVPEDERSRRALVDLNYRLNDPISAIRELDGLLRIYAHQRRASQIIQVLEEHVTRYSKDMALRSRLAAVYRQTGNVSEAVAQLDSLAELQLEAGLHHDAMVTIRRIIALNPEHIQDYQRLLHQLSG